MINISIDQIIERVVEEKQVTSEEVKKKISGKLEELSGLISEEGAAHIVANEYGVDLMKQDGSTKIETLLPGMKGVEVDAKVIRVYEVRTFQRQDGPGKVGKCLIGDDSGITMLTLWDEKSDVMSKLNEQDTIKITKCDVRENRGRKEIHVARDGEVQINPEGVEVETRSAPQKKELQKKKISELTKEDTNVELFVTLVQIFDPKFFEGRPDDTGDTQGVVLNLFADDGSDNIRCVFWKESIMKLCGISKEELLSFKDDPAKFEAKKTDLLGKMARLRGKVQDNEMFGRLEFVAYEVDFDTDPKKRLEEVKSDSKDSSQAKQGKAEEAVATTSEASNSHASEDSLDDDDLEIDDEDVMSLDDLDKL